ncbi:MAG: hypothetical protein IPG22_20765 [Acidobacteria bacterium]|nr:hypothetical protein [Acidobacteriota bacterium]
MQNKKRLITASALLLLTFVFAAPQTFAKTSEYDKIVSHLKTKYQAKEGQPRLCLARTCGGETGASGGSKELNVTLFRT